jgi:hypothetical protein
MRSAFGIQNTIVVLLLDVSKVSTLDLAFSWVRADLVLRPVYFSSVLNILYAIPVCMEKQQWKRMNGSQGAQPACMRNGPAFSVNNAMRWLGTPGMTNGGIAVSYIVAEVGKSPAHDQHCGDGVFNVEYFHGLFMPTNAM